MDCTLLSLDTSWVVSVPDPLIHSTGCIASPACKYSGSGDFPVYSMFLRHLWNATIKATSTHLINQNYIFMKSYVLHVNI